MGDKLRQAFSALSILVLASCGELTHHREVVEQAPVDSRIGWLHGNCLAVKNPDIPGNRAITVAALDEPVRYGRAKVIGPASGADECPALMEDRRSVNIGNGYSFYQVSDTEGLDLGIGFLDMDAKVRNYHLDYCTTSEGVQFHVRDGSALVWTGYYYLGYDTEVTCGTEHPD